jgi:hypothetical protein
MQEEEKIWRLTIDKHSTRHAISHVKDSKEKFSYYCFGDMCVN